MKNNYAGVLYEKNKIKFDNNKPSNEGVKKETGFFTKKVPQNSDSETEENRAYAMWEILHTARLEEVDTTQKMFTVDEEGSPLPNLTASKDKAMTTSPNFTEDDLRLLINED